MASFGDDDSPRSGGRPRTRARVTDYPLVEFWDPSMSYGVDKTVITDSADGIAIHVSKGARLDSVEATIQYVDPSRVYSVRCDKVAILAHLLQRFPNTTEVICGGYGLEKIVDRVAGLDRIESLQILFESGTTVLDAILRRHGRTIRTLHLIYDGPDRPFPELAHCTGPIAHLDVELFDICSQDVHSLLARCATTLKSFHMFVKHSSAQWFPVGRTFPRLSSLKASWQTVMHDQAQDETAELNKLLDASPNLRSLDLTLGPSVDHVRVPVSVVHLEISGCSTERMRALLADNLNRDVGGYAFDDEAQRLSEERHGKLVGRIVEDFIPQRPLGKMVVDYLR